MSEFADYVDWKAAHFEWTTSGYELTLPLTVSLSDRQIHESDYQLGQALSWLQPSLIWLQTTQLQIRSWNLFDVDQGTLRHHIEQAIRTGRQRVHDQIVHEESVGESWLTKLRALARPAPDDAATP